MKYTEFTYTDAKGKTTERQVLVIQEPSNKLTGFDVSEISDRELESFVEAYDAAQKRFLAEVEVLKAEFELSHSFRQFIDTNIKDRV